MAQKRLPKRSAFDDLSKTTDETTPGKVEMPVVQLGPKGMDGLRIAGEKKRPRSWEREHQYGKGYSVKGVRPDINLWLLNTAEELGVRVAEVAVYALMYSMDLVDSGDLLVRTNPNPRGALMTLFPGGYDRSGGEEAQAAIQKLAGKSKGARKKGKRSNGQTDSEWKSKPVNWTPFDQSLKERIVVSCRDKIPQGEFVTFLLERARDDHQAGLLVFNPRPRTIASADAK